MEKTDITVLVCVTLNSATYAKEGEAECMEWSPKAEADAIEAYGENGFTVFDRNPDKPGQVILHFLD